MSRFTQRMVLNRSWKQRRGISIIEVLVSMFILSVGLLGIASLLPIGQRQAALADQQDRLSSLGQNAIRSFRTRGYSNPAFWMVGSGSGPTGSYFSTPILIDPLMAAKQSSGKVPHSGTQVIPRYSVKPTTTSTTMLNIAGAEAMFISRDDVLVEFGNLPEDATKAKFEEASSSKIRRDFNGEYSWAAMLAPTYPGVKPLGNDPTNTAYDYGKPYAEQSCQLSIIVFYRRNLSVLTDQDTVSGQAIPRERAVSVVSFDGNGIGGGEVTIKTTGGSYDTMLKIGEYVLLYQAPTGSPGNTGYKPYRAQWYRVLGADAFVAGDNRQVTLTGADWDTGNGYNTPQMLIFDGAVGVYNKTIRLEGPSMWNN
jgi:type II secretory pathway pseudopilin PulG